MSRIYSDPAVTDYHTPGHVDSPRRVTKSRERLESAGYRIVPPEIKASEEDVRLVHAPEHFAMVRDGDYRDADTPHYPGIEAIALVSLSGALSAAQSAADREPAFSLMRPPGHHAGKKRVSGFCYFNNIAIACEKLLRGQAPRAPGAVDGPAIGPAENAVRAVGILDIDVHHGNGTEELMTRRDGVLLCSLHQVPLYPGTGLHSHDNCFNFPLVPGTGETEYLQALEEALKVLLDFRPDVLAVSAGFDTYRDCPIAQLRLEKKSYRRIGDMIAQTGLKRFAVLEGGYSEDLPILIENFLDKFLS
jgi:acetoin utilization deacetylase AcuC-like enzyme